MRPPFFINKNSMLLAIAQKCQLPWPWFFKREKDTKALLKTRQIVFCKCRRAEYLPLALFE